MPAMRSWIVFWSLLAAGAVLLLAGPTLLARYGRNPPGAREDRPRPAAGSALTEPGTTDPDGAPGSPAGVEAGGSDGSGGLAPTGTRGVREMREARSTASELPRGVGRTRSATPAHTSGAVPNAAPAGTANEPASGRIPGASSPANAQGSTTQRATNAPPRGSSPGGTVYPQAPSAPGTQETAPPNAPAEPPDADSDSHAPVLAALTFTPPRIEDGSATTVVMTATDDLSGVRYVSVSLTSPSGKASVATSGKRQGESDQWIGTLEIPKDAESGTWFVANVNLGDMANNSTSAGYSSATSPPGWRLEVQSPESDSQAPVLEAIWVERPSVQELEKQVLMVKARDDESGLASINGSFQSPSKAAMLYFGCRPVPDSDNWAAEIPIPRGADCGEWTINQLTLIDKARNIAGVGPSNPLLANLSFVVSRAGECDSTAPELRDLQLAPTQVSNEEQSEIAVTASVTDEGTGVISVGGRVDGPTPPGGGRAPMIYFSCARQGSEPGALWTGKIVVPKFSAKGTWRVAALQVKDNANNQREYGRNDPPLANATFEVK